VPGLPRLSTPGIGLGPAWPGRDTDQTISCCKAPTPSAFSTNKNFSRITRRFQRVWFGYALVPQMLRAECFLRVLMQACCNSASGYLIPVAELVQRDARAEQPVQFQYTLQDRSPFSSKSLSILRLWRRAGRQESYSPRNWLAHLLVPSILY
jgi:hypothetical protein